MLFWQPGGHLWPVCHRASDASWVVPVHQEERISRWALSLSARFIFEKVLPLHLSTHEIVELLESSRALVPPVASVCSFSDSSDLCLNQFMMFSTHSPCLILLNSCTSETLEFFCLCAASSVVSWWLLLMCTWISGTGTLICGVLSLQNCSIWRMMMIVLRCWKVWENPLRITYAAVLSW